MACHFDATRGSGFVICVAHSPPFLLHFTRIPEAPGVPTTMSFTHDEVLSALEPFVHEGWITEIVREIKSGKEATVYCCRGGPRTTEPQLAAKVYRPIESRRFRNDAIYQAGRMHLARDSRVKRA